MTSPITCSELHPIRTGHPYVLTSPRVDGTPYTHSSMKMDSIAIPPQAGHSIRLPPVRERHALIGSGNTPCYYQAVLAVQMKNWEPLVLAPELAIDKIPLPVCFNVKFSSLNLEREGGKKEEKGAWQLHSK